MARDPTNYEDIGGENTLKGDEIEALTDEVLHKWKQPKALYFTIVCCSIGAAVQGWDQTGMFFAYMEQFWEKRIEEEAISANHSQSQFSSLREKQVLSIIFPAVFTLSQHLSKISRYSHNPGSNGANLAFPRYFHIDEQNTRDQLIQGLINAAPYIGSALFGCWLSDPLNSYFGRRGTIFVAGNICLWTVLGSAFTQTWPQALVCRILLGLGMGAKASTVRMDFRFFIVECLF